MKVNLNTHQEFLLPASNLFIALSILAAVALNWLPWSGVSLILKPDFIALVLLYWCTHKPNRVGIGFAWLVGIFADVADNTLFGQHALAYVVLAFGGIALNRRIQMFDLRQQMAQIFPLLLSSYLVFALIHWQTKNFVVWEYFLGSLTSTALWIPMTLLLQFLRHPRYNPNEL